MPAAAGIGGAIETSPLFLVKRIRALIAGTSPDIMLIAYRSSIFMPPPAAGTERRAGGTEEIEGERCVAWLEISGDDPREERDRERERERERGGGQSECITSIESPSEESNSLRRSGLIRRHADWSIPAH